VRLFKNIDIPKILIFSSTRTAIEVSEENNEEQKLTNSVPKIIISETSAFQITTGKLF